MEVTIQDNKWRDLICDPEGYVKELTTSFLEDLSVKKPTSTLSIVLAGDALLSELNFSYRKISGATNVLSFNYEDVSHTRYLGEIFISAERIALEAADMQIAVLEHLTHMLIHGILHVLGYDHQTAEETEEMQALEISLLRKRNIGNPYEK